MGMRWGGLDQCMTTTRSGCCRLAAIFVAGMPDVFEARTTSGPTCCSYLGVRPLLELEVLGDGLDHELGAREGIGDLAHVAHRAALDDGRLEPVEDPHARS